MASSDDASDSDGGEGAAQPDGLLTRLDDKLDELEAAHRLSRPQLQEEDYVLGAASIPGPRRRQPLALAVRDLTCQWSEGFQALAETGDTACQFIVAQMLLAPKGYGSLAPNRTLGIQWLMRAVDGGDIEARAFARKACRRELMEHLARKYLAEEAAAATAAGAAAAGTAVASTAAASTAAASAASASASASSAAASPSTSAASASTASPGPPLTDPDESALRIAMELMELREVDVAKEEQKQREALAEEFGE